MKGRTKRCAPSRCISADEVPRPAVPVAQPAARTLAQSYLSPHALTQSYLSQ